MKKNENKLAVGAKVAPAVGLLLFGEHALAQVDDGLDQEVVAVSEPSTLALFAIGAAAAGVTHAVKKWREK